MFSSISFVSTRQISFLASFSQFAAATISASIVKARGTTRYFSRTSVACSNKRWVGSARGRKAVTLLPTYLADARQTKRYHPETDPDGALQLGVAESLMMEDWLVPALNNHKETNLNLSADKIYYQPTAGREDCRRAMASYIEQLTGLEAGRLDIEGLVLGSGCNAVLENLCFCIAEAGDAVLVPTPYYAAFEFDLAARADLYVQPVRNNKVADLSISLTASDDGTLLDPSVYYPTASLLDAAREEAIQAGHNPRILLLSHPHNPLGIYYPSEVVDECIQWCRTHQIHLISDEIYAGSVYWSESFDFVSALKVADNPVTGLGPFVHWVYSLSKDFALSGLRVGAVYTENNDIYMPLQKLNDLCQISSQTQEWTRQMLTSFHNDSSKLWVQLFRQENHKRLQARQDALVACLTQCEIPYLAPSAGLFCWIDLSKYLPKSKSFSIAAKERTLYLELVERYGLLFTPGLSMRHERPGFFRCVFSAANDEEFALSLERMRKFVASKTLA